MLLLIVQKDDDETLNGAKHFFFMFTIIQLPWFGRAGKSFVAVELWDASDGD